LWWGGGEKRGGDVPCNLKGKKKAGFACRRGRRFRPPKKEREKRDLPKKAHLAVPAYKKKARHKTLKRMLFAEKKEGRPEDKSPSLSNNGVGVHAIAGRGGSARAEKGGSPEKRVIIEGMSRGGGSP